MLNILNQKELFDVFNKNNVSTKNTNTRRKQNAFR